MKKKSKKEHKEKHENFLKKKLKNPVHHGTPRVKVSKEVRVPERILKESDIAIDFAMKVHEKFDKIIKATILFGSQAKGTATENSDVDIIVVIDDASIKWDLELIAWYREELGKMVARSVYPKELHINTIKLTTWWEDLLEGDPVIINIIRYGEVLIDSGGFFNPLKILLKKGKIKSTVEAVYTALQRAPTHLIRSRNAKLGAIEGIYWAMIDSSQAALITAGKLPPSPEHIPELLKETFVDTKMSRPEYAIAVKDIYNLHKKIVHSEIYDVKGDDIDKWQETAQAFITEMTRIIDLLVEESRKAETEEESENAESTSQEKNIQEIKDSTSKS
ncbi:hypothetical protein COU54_00060 [Candidatus Pacearchaeota archaeon CG10_big_fil_rev_8_21_14_0_10_31_24]|nr:MAG: hypothetical protein COU54_00060 [Candidatus Pacearchaeota archaeon CG10_big_fil_rev_8_21_14_0_10_31_24]